MGLLDPAQLTLIALTNVTVGLLAYAADEMAASSDEGVFEQHIAVIRQLSILALMDHAIETLAEVHFQLEAEDEAVSDLVSRATAVLREGAPMTAEDLATELEVDLETLAETLGGAIANGEVFQETHYRLKA